MDAWKAKLLVQACGAWPNPPKNHRDKKGIFISIRSKNDTTITKVQADHILHYNTFKLWLIKVHHSHKTPIVTLCITFFFNYLVLWTKRQPTIQDCSHWLDFKQIPCCLLRSRMSDLQCSREVLHIYESGREISTKTDIILPQEKFTTQQSPDLDSEESKITKQRLSSFG